MTPLKTATIALAGAAMLAAATPASAENAISRLTEFGSPAAQTELTAKAGAEVPFLGVPWNVQLRPWNAQLGASDPSAGSTVICAVPATADATPAVHVITQNADDCAVIGRKIEAKP